VAVLATAAALAATAGPPAERTPAGIGDIYVSFGGYMASGDGASDKATTAYPAVLLKSHLEPGAGKAVQLLDLGKDENTVENFLGDYRSEPQGESTMAKVMQAIADARGQGLRVSPITIEMGGEEALGLVTQDEATQNEGMALLRDELAFILDELVDAITDAEGRRTGDIVLLSYYNPYPDVPEVTALSGRLNALIRKMARVRGLGVADIDQAFAGKQATLLNGLVPNDEGHKVAAAEIWKATGYSSPAAGN
jgi:hypothetical protein